jgi:nickel/cobalt exporter
VSSLHDAGRQEGAHGAVLIGARGGFVEISVFETGVPPRFRLYFVGGDGTPQPSPEPAAVTLETVRPSGARQVFAFVSGGSYVESAEVVPEPHEFSVKVRWDGEELPETRFTEHEHDHGHDGSGGPHAGHGYGHSHGASAHEHGDHDHGRGLLAWFGGVFGHSHSVAERIDETMESNERGIWALKISLVGLGLTPFSRW